MKKTGLEGREVEWGEGGKRRVGGRSYIRYGSEGLGLCQEKGKVKTVALRGRKR